MDSAPALDEDELGLGQFDCSEEEEDEEEGNAAPRTVGDEMCGIH